MYDPTGNCVNTCYLQTLNGTYFTLQRHDNVLSVYDSLRTLLKSYNIAPLIALAIPYG